jgi:hypothetical protein
MKRMVYFVTWILEILAQVTSHRSLQYGNLYGIHFTRYTLQSFHSKHKVTRHLCVIIIINLVAWYLLFHVQYSVRNMFMAALKLKVLYIRPHWLGTNGHWTVHGSLVSSFLSIFFIIKHFFPWFLICLKRCCAEAWDEIFFNLLPK